MTEDGIAKRQTRRHARAAGVPYTKALADRRLIETQIAFYDDRAPDYGEEAPTDRNGAKTRTSLPVQTAR